MDDRVKIVYDEMTHRCNLCCDLNEDNFYDVVIEPLQHSNLPFNISYDQGVSKGVLLIEGASEVIKIPFMGRYNECAYDDAMNEYETQQEALDRGKDIPDKCLLAYPEYKDYFDEFQNAATPYINGSWDYCALECKLYREAELEHLDEYFARETCIGEIDDHPIYIQTRAIIYEDCENKEYSADAISSARTARDSTGVSIYNPEWISDFLDYYGEAEFKRLSHFLNIHRLKDFHDGNLGYINGTPVLVDYSSFKED